MAPPAPLTPAGFQHETGVSRETLARLERYAAHLERWAQKINLVGKDSLPDLWRRHMLDSAQLYPLLPPAAQSILDVGSGAGFPGLVLALMGVPETHLVEADRRKAVFLAEAVRLAAPELKDSVKVLPVRIEQVAPFPVAAVVARAVAPVDQLLEMVEPFLGPESPCLFLKGRRADAELTEAAKGWTMTAERLPSRSDPSGTILRLTHVRRR